MNILIAGDFFISDEYANKELLSQSVVDLFHKTDCLIVNLEAPLTDEKPENKILKTGPHLRLSENTMLPYLKQLKIDVVTLANNHILDYGSLGLLDTFESLDKNKISYIGAGRKLNDATKPLTLEKDFLRIAIINFCEAEWSIAEYDSPGANPMNIIDNSIQIKKAKASHDKVIVIVHGGHEFYNFPSPRMQKQYRFYVDQGADIVVGHHSHCISGNEVYKGVPIYYSLGNLLFTINSLNNEWYTGLVLELVISKGEIKHQVHPVKQEREGFNLSLLAGNEKEQILERIAKFNKIIQDKNQVNDQWNKFIEMNSDFYLDNWSLLSFVGNKYLREILRRLGIKFLNRKGASQFLNSLLCEAHRDMSIESLKKYLK